MTHSRRPDGLEVEKGPAIAFNTLDTMQIPPLVDERRSRKLVSDGQVPTYAKQPPSYPPDSGIMHWLSPKIVGTRYESCMKVSQRRGLTYIPSEGASK
jgi:hypothetical protein